MHPWSTLGRASQKSPATFKIRGADNATRGGFTQVPRSARGTSAAPSGSHAPSTRQQGSSIKATPLGSAAHQLHVSFGFGTATITSTDSRSYCASGWRAMSPPPMLTADRWRPLTSDFFRPSCV